MIKSLYWSKGKLYLLNQRVLPHKKTYIRYNNSSDVASAIRNMIVRGAPAIGITAAFGIVLAGRERKFRSVSDMYGYLKKSMKKLSAARPTAVNLFWAINHMDNKLKKSIKQKKGR